MTSRSSLGTQWPPQRSISGGISRAPARGISQSQYPSYGLARKPESIDLTVEAGQRVEPQEKHLRDDVLVTNPAFTGGPGTSRSPAVGEGIISEYEPLRQVPSGRPKMYFRDGEKPRPNSDARIEESVTEKSLGREPGALGSKAPPPMPIRPCKNGGRQASGHLRATGSRAGNSKKDPLPKIYTLGAPPFAPSFPQETIADFFPWTGNHPEDVLTEQATKQGFYDKTQVSQNETNTARPSLWPSFKHKSGLQTLSTLFTSVFEQRQAHGRVVAASTFKPPPRVTLTDTKREAWLRDLANPSVPLRRLSRTIPHGIRGKILLEQCLSKNIPTSRAVWLAKCVGANEIRAFKRKGASGTFAMGGEVRWIRDWTVFVEQFVEGVVGNCGESDWRNKITYVIRLSSHLYSEYLLDQDLYLEWVLASLEGCLLERIPIWLLILQIVWSSLAQSRRHGRRLAEALLSRLDTISTCAERDLYVPVIERLSQLTVLLMDSHSRCFVIPFVWSKYSALLQSCVGSYNPSAARIFENLDSRNKRLSSTEHIQKNDKAGFARRRLIGMLDQVDIVTRVDDLSVRCLVVSNDRGVLTQTLLEWVSSTYREGLFRVFLAVRLIRQWRRLGIDTDQHILDFLSASGKKVGLQKQNIFQLLSELICSKHFSVGNYLEWLISSGALNSYRSLLPDDPCDVRLLAEIPIHRLSSHSRNLRQMLLASVNFSVHEESLTVSKAKVVVVDLIPDLFPIGTVSQSELLRTPNIVLSQLSGTIKSEISRWIRQHVVSHTVKGDPVGPSNWKDLSVEVGTSALTVPQFVAVRSILEDLEDYTILADVLKSVTSSDNPIILASIADTLNHHLQVFAAIGAHDDLFQALIKREQSLRVRRPSEKYVLLSFMEVGSRIAENDQTLQWLAHELSRCDQKSAVAACSPVSDHMVEVLQSADVDFHEEIERLLASGTSIDKNTMARMFATVVSRIESSWFDAKEQASPLGFLLSRLRAFDLETFDTLLVRWVEGLLTMHDRPALLQCIPSLVNAGCVTLDAVVDCAQGLIGAKGGAESTLPIRSVAIETLELLIQRNGSSKVTSALDFDEYRFALEQLRFIREHPLKTLMIICKSIESDCPDGDAGTSLEPLVATTPVISILRTLLISHTEAVQRSLLFTATRGASSNALLHLKQVVDRLLDPQQKLGISATAASPPGLTLADIAELDPEVQIERILLVTDEFSLPFCKVKLQLLFTVESSAVHAEPGKGQDSVLTAVFQAVEHAADGISYIWAELISVLDDNVARHVRERAEEHLLSEAPVAKGSPIYNAESLESSEYTVRRYLSIVAATAHSISEVAVNHIAPLLTEKLNNLGQLLSRCAMEDAQSSLKVSDEGNISTRKQECDFVRFWINVLLRLIMIHRVTLQRSKTGLSEYARLLIALSFLLLNDQIQHDSDLIEYVFDVTASLVDDLSEDARAQCTRFLKDKSQDPRLQYLFGYRESPSEWLQLSQRGKLIPYPLRAWEILPEPAPNVGENDTSLSLGLFQARKA
ncbi:MAG: RNA polymerase II mediator complex subunit [Pycnora praestabilis]|nr:MAG: RNA polymerase II mediator complex subunit [Pycnora praestabilis]